MAEEAKNGLPPNYEKQVEATMAMAMSIIYNDQVKLEEKHIPEALESAGQQAQHPDDAAPLAIADVSLWVLSMIEGRLEKQGKELQPIVVAGVIGNIVAEVYELAQAGKLVEANEEDLQVSIATAINKYIAMARQEGKISDEELQEVAELMQKEHPEETKKFQDMMQARMQRQEQGGQQAQPAQQGLLGGQNV